MHKSTLGSPAHFISSLAFRRGLAEIPTLLQLPAKICRRLQTAYLTIPKADKRGRGFVHPKYRAYAAYLTTD
jgi:hypothetical protein